MVRPHAGRADDLCFRHEGRDVLRGLDVLRVPFVRDEQGRCLDGREHSADIRLVPDMGELAGDVRGRGVSAHHGRHQNVLRMRFEVFGPFGLGLGPAAPNSLVSHSSSKRSSCSK